MLDYSINLQFFQALVVNSFSRICQCVQHRWNRGGGAMFHTEDWSCCLCIPSISICLTSFLAFMVQLPSLSYTCFPSTWLLCLGWSRKFCSLKKELISCMLKGKMQCSRSVRTWIQAYAVAYPTALRSTMHSSRRNSGASMQFLAHAFRHNRKHASYATNDCHAFWTLTRETSNK